MNTRLGFDVRCGGCNAPRPDVGSGSLPRSPCPKCGATNVHFDVAIEDFVSASDSVSAELLPGAQGRDWSQRWRHIQNGVADLCRPRTGGMSADSIHAMRNSLHLFFV